MELGLCLSGDNSKVWELEGVHRLGPWPPHSCIPMHINAYTYIPIQVEPYLSIFPKSPFP